MDKRIYMDHAATTPMNEKALERMLPYFRGEFGNPSAVYSYGQSARNAVEKSRNRIAKALGALPTEVFFTSGGTESDNWAIRGVCAAESVKGKHIISSQTEHNAVRKTIESLEQEGCRVTWLQPDNTGRITPEQLEAAIDEDTILISIMLANNVVGTIQDIPALSRVARSRRVLFHTDAVQAVGHIPLNARGLGADLLSISAHKFGGPKGIGALYCRLPRHPRTILTGGGQERELRSGTENVPAIVGMAEALEEAVNALPKSMEHLRALQDRMIRAVTSIPGVFLTGDPEHRLPGFCSFVIEGIPHSVLLVNALNECGICASSGSACSASSKEASHVLLALGYDKDMASASLRLTMGTENTEAEVDYTVECIENAIMTLRGENKTRPPRLRK